jgi:hypothetical protein
VYAAACLLFPLLTPAATRPLSSLPRFVLVVFPLFMGAAAVDFCAQPSRYLIEKPKVLSFTVRKTWLSGISPTDAEAASPVSAPDDAEVGAVAVDGAVTSGVAAALAGDDAPVDVPQPATTRIKHTATAPPTTLAKSPVRPMAPPRRAILGSGRLRAEGSLADAT